MKLVCARRHRESYPIESSSGSKVYTVRVFREDDGELPSCTCTGFMTKRNKLANQAGGGYAGAGSGLTHTVLAECKHIREVQDNICSWPGYDALNATSYRAGQPSACPQCGGPLVSSTSPRIAAPVIGKNGQPKPRKVPKARDPQDVLKDLVSLVADLKS